MITRSEAAVARRSAVAAPADRPSQRRCAPDAGSLSVARITSPRMVIRASEDKPEELRFSGYATVTEVGYEMYDMYGPYTEVVSREAPALALASNPDVSLVLNHRGVTLARTLSGTLQLSADEVGLLADASMDGRMPSVQDVQFALARGDLTEMSFKFRITQGQWSPDYTEYRIERFDIDRGDVSIVNFGANPHTFGSLRAQPFNPADLTDEQIAAAINEASRRNPKPAMTRAALDLAWSGNNA